MGLEDWRSIESAVLVLCQVQQNTITDRLATLSFKLDLDHLMNHHQADSHLVSLLMVLLR